MRYPTTLVLLSTLLLPAAAQTQQAERYTLTGREVAFYDLVGSARIELGSGSEVVIEVSRRGPDADRLRIERGAIAGVQTLRVIFPADDIVAPDLERNSSSNLNVNDDGTWNRQRGGGGRRVRIHGRDRGNNGFEASADLVVRVPAGVTVRGNVAVGEIVAVGSRSDLVLSTMAGDIAAERVRGRVEAHTASGNVSVTDGEGDAEIHTASGNVDLMGVRAGQLDVDVASGNITTSDVNATTIGLESASGSLRVRRTKAESLNADAASGTVTVRESEIRDLRAASASGSVDVSLEGPIRRATISSASGSVTVALAPNVDATIDAESSSGDIEIDFPLQMLSQRRNHIRARVGNGTGQISVSAASGNVRITRVR